MFRSTRQRATVIAVGAAAALVLSGCGTGDGDNGSGEGVTLDFSWWGNDDRAGRYEQVIELFEAEHPDITINGTFSDFPSYWEQRQTEAAGGGLPDVMQFDYSYVRQYGENGLLLDLGPHLGQEISVDAIDESLLSTGELDGATFAIPTGYNAWSLFQNPALLDEVGADAYPGGTSWAEYNDHIAGVTDASGGEIYGGTDWTQRIQNFELWLRQQGAELYSDDGQLGFDEADLTEFWNLGADLRDGAAIPQSRLEELNPVSGMGANLTTSELTWSNFMGGLLGDSGAEELTIVAPPTDDPGTPDLYLKPALMQAIAADTEHPEAAATFVDFLINSPESGEIFGATLGIPASQTALEGAALEGPDAQVADYLESISDRVGDAPSLPVEGYGAVEQTFWDLGKAIGLGATSVDDAVQQFFDEAAVVLGG